MQHAHTRTRNRIHTRARARAHVCKIVWVFSFFHGVCTPASHQPFEIRDPPTHTTHSYVCACACVSTCVYGCERIRVSYCRSLYTNLTHAHAYTHTHTHTRTHTHTHAHARTHTQVDPREPWKEDCVVSFILSSCPQTCIDQPHENRDSSSIIVRIFVAHTSSSSLTWSRPSLRAKLLIYTYNLFVEFPSLS